MTAREKVVYLEDRDPRIGWLHGWALCSRCFYQWMAVWPDRWRIRNLECPACGGPYGDAEAFTVAPGDG